MSTVIVFNSINTGEFYYVRTRLFTISDVSMAFRRAIDEYCVDMSAPKPLVSSEYAIGSGNLAAAFIAATRTLRGSVTLAPNDKDADNVYVVVIGRNAPNYGVKISLRIRTKKNGVQHVLRDMPLEDFANLNQTKRQELDRLAQNIKHADYDKDAKCVDD